MKTQLAGLVIASLLSGTAFAEDFPMPGCHGWNATVVSRAGINSEAAIMSGVVTPDNMMEYCIRMQPSNPDGSKISPEACAQNFYREVSASGEAVTVANCQKGTLQFFYNGMQVNQTFPGSEDDDHSCAAGWASYAKQFSMICPDAANAMRLDQLF